MAKRNKAIGDFQKALLTNTKYIKNHSEEDVPLLKEVKDDITITIDKKTNSQFKILAKYLGKEKEELINEALQHFLKLKSVKLEKAFLELTKESD